MSVQVLGLGTAAMDIVLQCDELPREDGFSFIHREQLMPGGSCANVLVALAQLGVRTGLVAQIGDDQYGRIFLQDLQESGVEPTGVFVKEKGVTLHTFITVAKNGTKAIFAHLGDSLLTLAEEAVTEEMLEGVKVFYTDMFAGQAALKLARLCKERGIPVVFNLECPPSFMALCQVSREKLEEILSLADLIFSCREGLVELAGTEDPMVSGPQVYEKYHPGQGLVFTLGDKGSICFYDQGRVAQTGVFQVDAVDTTGAGDAFVGGFIFAYFLQNKDRELALRFASACAALKCTQLGARLQAGEQDVWALLNRG
ncbi:carbohydrate kinase family protein [Candidatus Formimonas warabiya]|uniref:Carbohydrate kinase PfkB domain-containing protein n=1 Tax=Formimonas warabiya TaxID=1761012 RepID=A0A3G1KZ62_FORW1|nr:carbohydrate kinase family protein [Candidatus Formimonas warabiya]ATW27793.1 hypothetical protein DCMF_26270 [Candidatus Formimonas warabiya]